MLTEAWRIFAGVLGWSSFDLERSDPLVVMVAGEGFWDLVTVLERVDLEEEDLEEVDARCPFPSDAAGTTGCFDVLRLSTAPFWWDCFFPDNREDDCPESRAVCLPERRVVVVLEGTAAETERDADPVDPLGRRTILSRRSNSTAASPASALCTGRAAFPSTRVS